MFHLVSEATFSVSSLASVEMDPCRRKVSVTVKAFLPCCLPPAGVMVAVPCLPRFLSSLQAAPSAFKDGGVACAAVLGPLRLVLEQELDLNVISSACHISVSGQVM